MIVFSKNVMGINTQEMWASEFRYWKIYESTGGYGTFDFSYIKRKI